MEISEYLKSEIELKYRELRNEIKKLILDEAKKNVKYKTGDIIEDHFQVGEIIKIRIEVSGFSNTYDIYYICNRLTKKLKRFKSHESCIIYEPNIEKSHGNN